MKKYIALSALLHALLFAFIVSKAQSPQIEKKEKTVVIQVLKVEEPKPIEKPKPILKEEPKPKPVKKPKPIPKEEPKIEQKVVVKQESVAEPEFVVSEPIIQNETPKEEPQIVVPTTPTISQEEIQNAKDVYLAKLRKVIEEKKRYPKNAKRLKQSGVVHVKFTLLRDGTIQNAQIAQTSSFEILDSATIALLQAIAKTEPFPKELSDNEMIIILPIEYSLIN